MALKEPLWAQRAIWVDTSVNHSDISLFGLDGDWDSKVGPQDGSRQDSWSDHVHTQRSTFYSWVDRVGVDDSFTNQLGSSVVAQVPGLIPSLGFLFRLRIAVGNESKPI